MDLKGIVWIPGKPGLYKTVSQVKSATIVESLTDGTKFPIYMSDKASNLVEISMFTTGEEVLVSELMDVIFKKESGGPCIDPKSEDILIKKYFEEILPTYDKNQVYVSQMKKLFSWYNYLHAAGLLKMEEKPEAPAEEKTEEASKEETTE